MDRARYPFTAIVGQEPMKKALLLNAIHPALGGVLIRGQKGTAKSTAARGLASLLPAIETVDHCPFQCFPGQPLAQCPVCTAGIGQTCQRPMPLIDLPLGATEDRLIGTMHLETAIQHGRRTFEPGLLAAAHRGILYVDEVNLLEDHLVDALLDVAVTGVNVVEREGVSVSHPARFILVGTMNPEEGELRPQFLDRFALCIEVAGLEGPAERAEVVRRRLRFEADPDTFAREWQPEEARLAEQVAAARQRLAHVACTDDLLESVACLTVEMGVHGHRADLATVKTACALAAYDGRATVTADDIREAAELVLPHRMRRTPFEQPHRPAERLKQALQQNVPSPVSGDSVPDDSGKKKTPTPMR